MSIQPAGELSRRDQIVAAAAALFSVYGYHGTSMEDIGKRVGMLKGSLYAHVANKEELLLEIVSTASRRFTAALQPIARGDEPAPIKLRLALRAHLRTAFEIGPLAQVFLLEARHLEKEPARWIGEARERYEALWRQIVEQGMADGAFRAEIDARLAVSLALAAANWTTPQTPPREPAEADAFADRLAELLLDGLR
jgi:AcrR family transcriptional regulator